jgi:hypothetical protein
MISLDRTSKFPEILRAAGLRVERHADHFRHDAPDEEWLADIGNRDWIALTHDGRIRYKPNELATVMQNGVALLVVVGHALAAAKGRGIRLSNPRLKPGTASSAAIARNARVARVTARSEELGEEA